MSTAVLSASATDSSLVHDHEVVGEPQNEIQTVTTTSQFSYPQTQFVFEANPAEPVLYLPPILSLLPVEYRQLTTSLVDNQTAGQPTPLSTESHLPSIDKASLSLHLALHRFRAVTREYATVAYAEAFNWDEIELPEDDEHDWYCVAFNSKRRAGSDGDGLYSADKLAHEEAVHNGGLIMYWYGTPHPVTGMNLATCIWQSRQDAIVATSRPHHKHAMRLAAASYDHYTLRRFWLRKVKGERRVTIEPFDVARS